MNRVSRFTAGLMICAVAASAVASVGAIAGQFFRGFDMSDEAFVYSLSLAGGSLERGWFFSYAYLVSPLFELFGQQVWPMRVLRYLGYLLVSLLVAIGVVGFLQRHLGKSLDGWSQAVVVATALLGSLWAWVYLPPVISYNELTVWFILIITASLLFMESVWVDKLHWRSALLLGLVAGVFQGLLFLSKLPSAIGILVFVAIYVFAFRKFARQWLAFFLSFALGMAVSLGFLAVLQVPVFEIVQRGTQAVITGEGAPSGYQTAGRLNEYLVTIQDAIINLRGPIVMLVLAALVIFVVSKSQSVSTRTIRSGIAIVFVAVSLSFFWAWDLGVGQGGGNKPFEIGFALTYLMAFGFVLLGLAIVSVRKSFVWPILRIALLLMAVSGLAVVGTSNPITFQANLIAVPLLLVAAIGAIAWWNSAPGMEWSARPNFLLLGTFGVLGISALTFSLVWQGTWLDPYRQVPLSQQQSAIDSGILRGLTTDSNTARVATELPIIAKDLELTQTAATAWDNPGLVLFFNNSQFASTWQLPYVPSSTQELVRACLAKPQPLVVLDDNSSQLLARGGDPSRFYEAIGLCGAEYPGGYETIKKVDQLPPGFDVEVQLPRGE